MIYKIWHGECQSYNDSKTIEADSPNEAMKKCFKKDFKIKDANNSDIDRWIATDNTDDYYFIVKVKSN